jgi:hypothetical protein
VCFESERCRCRWRSTPHRQAAASQTLGGSIRAPRHTPAAAMTASQPCTRSPRRTVRCTARCGPTRRSTCQPHRASAAHGSSRCHGHRTFTSRRLIRTSQTRRTSSPEVQKAPGSQTIWPYRAVGLPAIGTVKKPGAANWGEDDPTGQYTLALPQGCQCKTPRCH